MNDLEKTLAQMASEALTIKDDEQVQLTEQDVKLGKEVVKPSSAERTWLEVVAGLLDGSIISLVVVLSVFIAGLAFKTAAFAAFLTLASVAITNFSSFLLGGIVANDADIVTLQTLMNYSARLRLQPERHSR